MQFHHGSRLKKIIEKSGITKTEIIKKSGVKHATLYNLFGYEELLPSKITPVLDVLNITVEDFYNAKKNLLNDGQAGYGLQHHIEALEREIVMLKEQLAAKDEIIQLLKTKRK